MIAATKCLQHTDPMGASIFPDSLVHWYIRQEVADAKQLIELQNSLWADFMRQTKIMSMAPAFVREWSREFKNITRPAIALWDTINKDPDKFSRDGWARQIANLSKRTLALAERLRQGGINTNPSAGGIDEVAATVAARKAEAEKPVIPTWLKWTSGIGVAIAGAGLIYRLTRGRRR